MLRITAICCFAALLLGGCGGGGDDGDGGEQVLVRATTTHSQPDSANTLRNDWLLDAGSPSSAANIPAGTRLRHCASGTWRQTLKSAATLRLTINVAGTVRAIDNIAGVAGRENRIAFSACTEGVTAVALTSAQAAASFELNARSNRAASPVDGYDLTIDWVVTRI